MITITAHDVGTAWEAYLNCDEGNLVITHTKAGDEVEVINLHPGKTITLERMRAIRDYVCNHMLLRLSKIAGTVSEEEVPF